MLLAAADPTGDATLLWRAAQALGVGRDAAARRRRGAAAGDRLPGAVPAPARAVGRLRGRRRRRIAAPPTWRSPRRRTHGADPERRVWHLARRGDRTRRGGRRRARAVGGAVPRPAAGWRPRRRSSQRAVALTADPGRRAGRALAAAEANLLRRCVRRGARPAGRRPRRTRSTIFSGPGWSSSAGRSSRACDSGPRGAGRCCSAAGRLEPLDAPARPGHLPRRLVASLVAGRLAQPAAICSRSPERHDRLRRPATIRSSATCSSTVSRP